MFPNGRRYGILVENVSWVGDTLVGPMGDSMSDEMVSLGTFSWFESFSGGLFQLGDDLKYFIGMTLLTLEWPVFSKLSSPPCPSLSSSHVSSPPPSSSPISCSSLSVSPPPTQCRAVDAEIKVPSGESTELKCSPFKSWSRSVNIHTCYAYCQGFLPSLFLPSRPFTCIFSKPLPIFSCAGCG